MNAEIVTNVVKTKKRVRKTITVETKTKEVLLHLTVEEAIALRILVGNVGGPPEGSIRRYTDKVYHVIDKLMPDNLKCGNFVFATTEINMAKSGRDAVKAIEEEAKKYQ